jgi:YHS domain-containing protein
MTIRLPILLLAILTFFIAPAAHAEEPIYTGLFSNVAVGGYDTVSYFTVGKPVKGQSEFSTDWKGAKWNFSSAENLETFKANPEKYAPQYGGYCAWAVADGSLAKGSPKQWNIENGKLYLNINKKIKQQWLADKTNFIQTADQNFPSLIK